MTVYALICWFPATKKSILEIQVASKINGRGGGGGGGVLTTPIIYLVTWISNIDFCVAGTARELTSKLLHTADQCIFFSQAYIEKLRILQPLILKPSSV